MAARKKTTSKAGKTTAVAKTDPNQHALATQDWGDYGGAGFENDTREDYAIPFLALLQKNSPQCDEDDERYIEGAKPGLFLNTVTEEIYDGDRLLFIPCFKQRAMVEWVPRENGGGFAGVHEPNGEVHASAVPHPDKRSLMKLENGNDLAETVYMYGLLVNSMDDTEPYDMAVIAFKSTGLKVVKHLNTKVRKVKGNPPLFAFVTALTSVGETNAHGTFKNYKFEFANGNAMDSLLTPDTPLFQQALQFHEMVKGGEAKADYSKQEAASSQDDDGDSPI